MTETGAHGEPTHTQEAFFATKPTAWTRFMRTCIPWQMVRFAIINLKMLRIIAKGHGG